MNSSLVVQLIQKLDAAIENREAAYIDYENNDGELSVVYSCDGIVTGIKTCIELAKQQFVLNKIEFEVVQCFSNAWANSDDMGPYGNLCYQDAFDLMKQPN